MPKSYAEWTEAEVVEYVIREVPQTALGAPYVRFDYYGTQRWRHVSESRPEHGGPGWYPIRDDVLVALWFRAAWEWVENQGAPGIPCVIDPDEQNWGVRDLNSDDPCEPRWLVKDLPTSIHALGAACLIAAGKVVPE